MDLFVCPAINEKDPADKKFDGKGHAASLAPLAGTCSKCDKDLVPASNAWRLFYGLSESSPPE